MRDSEAVLRLPAEVTLEASLSRPATDGPMMDQAFLLDINSIRVICRMSLANPAIQAPRSFPARGVSNSRRNPIVKTLKLSLVFAFVLVPMTAFAAVPWTGSPGSSIVDEAAAASTSSTRASSATTPPVPRRPSFAPQCHGYHRHRLSRWTTMEIRAYDPSPNSEVR